MEKKRNFSKRIVILCLVEMIVIQVWAMIIAQAYNYSTDALVVANHAVFGGELLLLCLKRIFAKPDDTIENELVHGELSDTNEIGGGYNDEEC